MVCRVCLKNSQLELQIFDENGVELRIPEILHQHLWFTPSPTDPISTVICLPCWCKLLEFHQFYEAAKEAHTYYSEQSEIFLLDKIEESRQPIVETVFDVKNEDIIDVKWQGPTTREKTKRHDGIRENKANPLYEPEVSVKSEEPETQNLDETLENQEKPSQLASESSEESVGIDSKRQIYDHDEDESDERDEDIEDASSDHSEYEPDLSELKKLKTLKAKPIKKRGRPASLKSKSTMSKTPKVPGNSVRKRKQEKRCWSNPEADEMVRKHLPLNCEICGFHVKSYTEMIKHFQILHKNVRAYIFCCGRRLSKRQRVIQHAYIHEDPNYFQCQICKKNFSDNYVLRSHMLAHHPEEEELVYKCDQCEKRFSRRYLLELHKPVHIPIEERKFVCPKCPTHKTFASDHLLKIHDSMRHKRATNVCHVCAKSIRDNQAFEKHVRLHFEESGPRVKCPRPGCDRWLKDEDNLKQHLRRHNDEGKIITCDQCGKCVKNRRALSSHISYAHSTALFSCEECKKTFKKAITLKEHMAQHTGETLYRCPFCPRTFNSNANMHSHKKKMHPIEWDIWRKTKTGSSQSIKSNIQVLETVANSLVPSSQGIEQMEQQQQQGLLEQHKQEQQSIEQGIYQTTTDGNLL